MIALALTVLALLFLFTVPPRLFGALVGLVVGWCVRDRKPP